MTGAGEATRTLLDERPELEDAVRSVVETEEATDGPWTFHDVDVDSGAFGELVSRGVVEKVDGDYRVPDVESVRAALAGEAAETTADERPSPSGWLPDDAPDFREFADRTWAQPRAILGLVGALFVVAAMRLTQYGSVFRDGRVVSPGNDPYFYRYWIEQMLELSADPTDLGLLAEMPGGATGRRPLSHAVNWWFTALLGGDQAAVDAVAAWLPIAAMVGLGIVVYAIAVVVTRDVRVGLASVLLFAIAPVHAVYTGVGFLEHRLHQYFWLGVTLLGLVWLAVDLARRVELDGPDDSVRGHLRSPTSWLVGLALGIALGISIHLWGGSPLVFVPLAGYVGLRAVLDARAGLSPTLANLPVLLALGVGSLLSVGLHESWGWHSSFVAYTPVLVLGGAIVVLGVGEVWRRRQLHAGLFVGLQATVAAVGLFAFRSLRPEDWVEAQGRMADLFLREGYTESVSLFTPDYAVLFGPLVQIGVGFYLAVGVLGWAIWLTWRRYEPGWLLLSVYTGYFIALAAIQLRFAAQLVVPLSVLGGVGFVYALSAVDLARVPRPFRGGAAGSPRGDGSNSWRDEDSGSDRAFELPDPRMAAYLLAVGLLLCSFSLLYVPSLTAQTTYTDGQYAAVQEITTHAEAADREYPDDFVLSRWGDNRMYNYFVNGESRGYGYAMSNFDEFRFGDDPDGWYGEFDGRVGYVVVTDIDADLPEDATQIQLLEEYGTGGPDGDALAHYRAILLEEDVAAFAVVPGATIELEGEPGATIDIETTATVSGETIAYERTATADENGIARVTVAYPGEYDVDGGTVTVSEADVEDGATVAE
ncbi:dolichyl-diphosphooligosaccharide--protein glycosyltransferase [Halalkaliarchaeum desulfuricum]|uniref:dolichyl-phosphooligosaccharide-protein glycotransferase n=1 Tax=Halalkaliarchaeum desulfuricum TaxID=2055893 RepID=A0A343TJ37_9EURY|nr:MFS transporter [Halalkaliarchaeum desulfuricum]AUX09109.1 dolichyl-diphosphooligosaccharide--protein glycosyltransferase [Halalkaliarchaeum desulfuricum]